MRQVTSQIMFMMMTMMVMMVVMMMMELMMTMVCMISNIDMIFQETDGVLLESYLIYEPDHQVDIICHLSNSNCDNVFCSQGDLVQG